MNIINDKAKVVELEIPIWYTKDSMYQYLISKHYSKEIAEELSEMWTEDLNQSFRKGFEKGYHYAIGKNIDATVKIIK